MDETKLEIMQQFCYMLFKHLCLNFSHFCDDFDFTLLLMIISTAVIASFMGKQFLTLNFESYCLNVRFKTFSEFKDLCKVETVFEEFKAYE